MRKDRFLHLCQEVEAGRDAFVRHSKNTDEGMVTGCDLKAGRMYIQTPDNQAHAWDYSECKDLSRPKLGPMA